MENLNSNAYYKNQVTKRGEILMIFFFMRLFIITLNIIIIFLCGFLFLNINNKLKPKLTKMKKVKGNIVMEYSKIQNRLTSRLKQLVLLIIGTTSLILMIKDIIDWIT